MKCLNYLCKNELQQNRINRQTFRISRWHFCIKCLKNSHYNPLHFKCHRKYCYNKVIYSGGIGAQRKYCSIICKRRNMLGTKAPEIKYCKTCNEPFVTHLGSPQKFCGKKCRDISTNIRQKREYHESKH